MGEKKTRIEGKGLIEDGRWDGWDEWDGMGWDGMGWDGMGWDGMGWDGMGWDGMGWDGMGWDGIGWDGWETCDEGGVYRRRQKVTPHESRR